jgi:hypothetical protein
MENARAVRRSVDAQEEAREKKSEATPLRNESSTELRFASFRARL